MGDEVRIISQGLKFQNFVRRLNFILNAIKILWKALTWHEIGCDLSLKDLSDSSGEWIGKGQIQNQGSHCRNPGEMIRAWAKGMRVTQERRKRI